MTAERELPPNARYFGKPWLVAFVMSWTVGVVDTFSFDAYGVFTTNQAGNLVVVASESVDSWDRSRLAVLSLVGAALGVIIGVLLRRRFPGPLGPRIAVPVVMGAAVLAGVGIASILERAPTALMTPLVAMGITCVAAGLIGAPGIRGWLTANTGSYLDAVSGIVDRDGPGPWWRRTLARRYKMAIVITLGFSAGALSYGLGLLNAPHPLVIGVLPMIITIVAALWEHRHVQAADAEAARALTGTAQAPDDALGSRRSEGAP